MSHKVFHDILAMALAQNLQDKVKHGGGNASNVSALTELLHLDQLINTFDSLSDELGAVAAVFQLSLRQGWRL